jgi:hypothetical protein
MAQGRQLFAHRARTMADATGEACSRSEAKAFYQHRGFRPSAIEPMTLMITIEEAQRMLGPLAGI